MCISVNIFINVKILYFSSLFEHSWTSFTLIIHCTHMFVLPMCTDSMKDWMVDSWVCKLNYKSSTSRAPFVPCFLRSVWLCPFCSILTTCLSDFKFFSDSSQCTSANVPWIYCNWLCRHNLRTRTQLFEYLFSSLRALVGLSNWDHSYKCKLGISISIKFVLSCFLWHNYDWLCVRKSSGCWQAGSAVNTVFRNFLNVISM